MIQRVPEPTRCPQCWSMHCGPIACRFSGQQHDSRQAPPLPDEEAYYEAPDEYGSWEGPGEGPGEG